MLAVRATPDEVGPLLGPMVSIAGLNAPKLTVISGEHDAISALAEELESRELATRRLATSHAFHSPMMEPIVELFARAVEQVPRQRAANAVRLESDRRLDHRRAGHGPGVLGTPTARARSLRGRRRETFRRFPAHLPRSRAGPDTDQARTSAAGPGNISSGDRLARPRRRQKRRPSVDARSGRTALDGGSQAQLGRRPWPRAATAGTASDLSLRTHAALGGSPPIRASVRAPDPLLEEQPEQSPIRTRRSWNNRWS